MPFITELIGVTSEEKNSNFISCRIPAWNFSKVLALIAALRSKPGDPLAFIHFTQNAVMAENHLHSYYFNTLA
ncbi:hypothetical protein [Pedobacter miscanthi]|uniref:Uncharacterized protein n=1 Tax=Pedobacter miscanthi TaxID=2259170 RepID=A0A366LDB9_9SPHI|nr:hypothetical protein [Pedobacter miscanthi]RBQ11483.1 hypothetical protein DRW42_03195 [Pedobacter miscanthi]